MGTSDISPLAVTEPRVPERAMGAGAPPVTRGVLRTAGAGRPTAVDAGDTAGAAFLTSLLALRADVADVGAVLDALAPVVREAFGGHVVDAVLPDARTARLVGGSVPHGPLADLVKRWRRGVARRTERAGGLAVVPLTDGGRFVGALRLSADADDPRLALLGARVGEVVARLVDGARHAEAAAAADALARRERLVRGLPGTVGGALAQAAPALDDLAAMALPPEAAARVLTARNAVARAGDEAAQAAAVLDLFGRRGLVGSLRAVARELSADRFAAVDVRTSGRPREVGAVAGEALFRVARTAAVSAVRHGRAMLVTVTVSYAPDRVAVTVRDDGAGLGARQDGEAGLAFGLRLLRRRLEELRGGLEVTPGRHGGVVVHAWTGVAG